jgi:Uma2 family endonuclease
MPAPLLVVEVVSPGKINEDRDYRYKRSEYAARGILEYWVVDAMQVKVTVFTLVEGFYEESIFSGDSFIISAIFPDLQLQAQDIFTAGEYLPPTE